MGILERKKRLKDLTRRNILKAALKIAKKDGWNALSMRKIADEIDYTAPVIYEYFTCKESLVAELSNTGYHLLASKITNARNGMLSPVKQIEAMWLAYWRFAFAEKELYQIMYGVETNCSKSKGTDSSAAEVANLFTGVISQLMSPKELNDDGINAKYYTFWSVIHGLISIIMVQKGTSDEINQRVLQEAIMGIIKTITH
jgi:AcrR family transcriptional regulator